MVTIDDSRLAKTPPAIEAILADTRALGFDMASEPRVGAALAALAASKPGGQFLELGTGTGHGTAWLLSGMDATSSLDTVETIDGRRRGPPASRIGRSRHVPRDRRGHVPGARAGIVV